MTMQLCADLFPQSAEVFVVSELMGNPRHLLHLSFRAKSRNL